MNVGQKVVGELVMRHKGASICVMGGGPTLKQDIERVTADIWISVNDHGARLRKVDYVVSMDNLHTKLQVPMLGHIRPHTDAPIIGPWHWCDYGLPKFPLQPRLMLSGVVATWVASLMGAHPIILAGFDCYGGRAGRMGQHRDYAKFVLSEVRVVSGPLQEMYPAYSPDEDMKPYVPPDVFRDQYEGDANIKVRVVKPVDVRGREWPKGAVLTVQKQEVWRQIKHGSLVELTAVAAESAPKRRGRPPKARMMQC